MWSIKIVLKLCLEDRTRSASHHNEKTVPNPEHSHQGHKNTQLLRNSYIVLCSGFFCLFFRTFLFFSNRDAAPWRWYCLSDTITNDFHDLKACWVQSTFTEWILPGTHECMNILDEYIIYYIHLIYMNYIYIYPYNIYGYIIWRFLAKVGGKFFLKFFQQKNWFLT